MTYAEYQKINSLYMREEKKPRRFTTEVAHPAFELIKDWDIYEKIDGTNIRVIYTPALQGEGIEGTTTDHIYFGGRTSDAQINANLMDYLRKTFTIEKFRENPIPFTCPVIICGEGIGPNIQGGKYLGTDYGFVLFDVIIDKWWLEDEKKKAIADHFEIHVCPKIDLIHDGGEFATSFYKMHSLPAIQEYVKTNPNSLFAKTETPMEGVVCRTNPMLFDKNGKMIIFKLKAKDFK